MIEQNSLPALLKTKAREKPQEVAQWILDNEGRWLSINFHSFYQEVVDLAWKLIALGINKGDVIAIMAATGREWELIHQAVLALGGIVVGIDPGEKSEQAEGIVKVAGIQTLVIDRLERLDIFREGIKAQFKLIITFDERSVESETTKSIFINIPKRQTGGLKNAPLPDVVHSEDIATIIFTSGTTGTPKGIAYRHDQIIAAIDAILETYPELTRPPCHLVCWMPLSNLFQRMLNLWAIACGAEVYFVEQPQKIIEYLPQINPHIFFAVPRFYEKLYQDFEIKLGQQPKIVVQCLHYCLTAGESNSLIGKLFRKINYRLFKSFTALLGSNIRYMVSGSAPMQLRLLKRFDAMGLLILEAYGLSENIVPIAANRPTDYRFGSVGKALKGNTIMLAEDSELLVKGPGVFNGYLADRQHDRSLNADGYLASGDYAEIDSHGFIRLTGRKSEVFKTSTGRKIAPVEIESYLKHDTEVEHAVVFGESRKFLVALVYVGAMRLEYKNETQKLLIRLSKSIEDLPEYKRPVGVILIFKSLSVEQQELTANQKLRRKNIQRNYGKLVDRLYSELDDHKSIIHHQPLAINSEIMLLKLQPGSCK
ncbi:MAG: AMP-binding protein [Methylococcaceae bacterium]|jgi:long-chain acyl-CoA synthetase